ncbi:MAG: ComF family protein [Candidatus Dadabacteria bacterium]|nr:ComF family protein [Candidatus Dadabacteria bacterium]
MLDLVFPQTCPGCDSAIEDNEKLCGDCLSGITFISGLSSCARCGIPFGFYKSKNDYGDGGKNEGHLCGRCLTGSHSFSKARSIALYDGKLVDIIYGFKYRGNPGLGDFLSGLLAGGMPYGADEFDVIVPVPLHINKLRSREYNQSAVLAKNLSKSIGVKHDLFGLKKTRDTMPQFEIQKEEARRKNVRGAFSVTDPDAFSGKSVLVVDDVFTTGSTTDECARALLKAGASEVRVLTVARARWA